MSLSRLASQHVARTIDVEADPIRAASAVARPDADDSFDLLTKYIPTETITLFVAAMSAKGAIEQTFPSIDEWSLYAFGAIATPLLLLLAAYGKQRTSGVKKPFRPHPFPYVASLIAYLAWALSVPGLLPEGDNGAKALAAGAALFVSTLLAMFEKALGPLPA